MTENRTGRLSQANPFNKKNAVPAVAARFQKIDLPSCTHRWCSCEIDMMSCLLFDIFHGEATRDHNRIASPEIYVVATGKSSTEGLPIVFLARPGISIGTRRR